MTACIRLGVGTQASHLRQRLPAYPMYAAA